MTPAAKLDSSARSRHLTYRADIDGLRAIAVLLVVLYHLHTAKCSGGFVGVDTFFVISGYLISSLIVSDIDSGRFSLTDFYERRIRRIFPALIVMLAGVAILADVTLLPTELKACGKSLMAALLSVSNFYFWIHTSYFDASTGASSITPLLHTWSLAVEEQFYLVLPLTLRALRSLPRPRLFAVLSLIAIASLIWSSITAAQNSSAAFYMLHTRAWELLLGTLLAICPERFQVPSALRDLVSLLGLALILWPSFTYTDDTPFPGLTAVPPCLGTALVIFAGFGKSARPGYVSRFLSLPPMRFVGLISYSLYLWHWPLIVFSHAYGGVSSLPARILKLSLLLLSVGIAALSWRFVEMPFRYGSFRPSRKQLFRIAFGGVASLVAVAGCLILFSGALTRWSPDAIRVASYLDYRPEEQFRQGTCFVDGLLGQKYNAAECLVSKSGEKNYLLIGDSHAAALWYGLSHTFAGVNTMQATASGCKPVIEDRFTPGAIGRLRERQSECRDVIGSIFNNYLPSHPPDALLIAANWDPEDIPGLRGTLQWTTGRGIPTILFGPMVAYDAPLPRLLALSIQAHDRALPDSHLLMKYWPLDADMRKLAGQFPGVKYVSLLAPMCEGHSCTVYAGDGTPLEFDSNHYTKQGSLAVAERIKASGSL